ncbi:hypothetical protein QFC22_000321 [Naganishia vaughanmartiniae]|uniref:Uncharacterized protein n=1 Tax=Naganishia vaughanmartiniae TaxID=1424756 RepID=A0ACC2XNZ2_9TREE|nr:hypothetical protein QFC22_000321 [Naganishia vaughanmartiniae]
MSDPQPAAAPAAQENRLWKAVRFAALIVGGQLVIKQLTSGFGPRSTPRPVSIPNPTQQGAAIQDTSLLPETVLPAWPPGTPLSLLVYTSDSTLSPSLQEYEGVSPLVKFENLTYGQWKEQDRTADVLVAVPESVRCRNASYWADVYLVPAGTHSAGAEQQSLHIRKALTRYMPRKKVRKEVSLLGNSTLADADEAENATLPLVIEPVISHWSPNLTFTLVSDGGPLKYASQAPTVRQHIPLLKSLTDSITAAEASDEPEKYLPILYSNEFWHLRDALVPLTCSSDYNPPTELPLRVTYSPTSMFKFNLYAHMNAAFEQQAEAKAAGAAGPLGASGGGGADLDELKKMLISANPYWLVITIIVTLLHTLFEFLAFSSDVSHWRKKDRDLVGVSLRSIVTNVVVQLIILLYLHDSAEETSFMILASQGMGLLVEAWKITKVVDIKVLPAPGSLIPYQISIEDKHELTEDEKKTQEYDKLAFKLVGYAAAPLMAGYTYYSRELSFPSDHVCTLGIADTFPGLPRVVNYKTHKGWYSFVITTLAQAIYMFGFAQLVPQLIINYKLKSVAHMPMKAMVYKTLTTIVDDCASFVIHMPWLHRLACFRDDVVFLILLYQRWIYRIDPTRANEYGQVLHGQAEEVGDLAAGADGKTVVATGGEVVKGGTKGKKDVKGRSHLKTE